MSKETLPGHPHQDVTDQHVHLRNLLEDISRCLGRRDKSRAEVLECLRRLQEELREHFEHEEAGGYFHEVIEIAPRFKPRLDALLAQHPDLKHRLDQLQRTAEREPVDDDWWHAVTEEFALFYDELDQHERGETEMLQDAYTRDVGTDD